MNASPLSYIPSLIEFIITGLQIYCGPCSPVAYQILVCVAHCHMLSLWSLCDGDQKDILSQTSHTIEVMPNSQAFSMCIICQEIIGNGFR